MRPNVSVPLLARFANTCEEILFKEEKKSALRIWIPKTPQTNREAVIKKGGGTKKKNELN